MKQIIASMMSWLPIAVGNNGSLRIAGNQILFQIKQTLSVIARKDGGSENTVPERIQKLTAPCHFFFFLETIMEFVERYPSMAQSHGLPTETDTTGVTAHTRRHRENAGNPQGISFPSSPEQKANAAAAGQARTPSRDVSRWHPDPVRRAVRCQTQSNCPPPHPSSSPRRAPAFPSSTCPPRLGSFSTSLITPSHPSVASLRRNPRAMPAACSTQFPAH